MKKVNFPVMVLDFKNEPKVFRVDESYLKRVVLGSRGYTPEKMKIKAVEDQYEIVIYKLMDIHTSVIELNITLVNGGMPLMSMVMELIVVDNNREVPNTGTLEITGGPIQMDDDETIYYECLLSRALLSIPDFSVFPTHKVDKEFEVRKAVQEYQDAMKANPLTSFLEKLMSMSEPCPAAKPTDLN